jgi:hypothetical protein
VSFKPGPTLGEKAANGKGLWQREQIPPASDQKSNNIGVMRFRIVQGFHEPGVNRFGIQDKRHLFDQFRHLVIYLTEVEDDFASAMLNA